MKTDLEILDHYESWFHSAIYSDYTKALWKSDFDVMLPIYVKWTGTTPNINYNCSKCKLNFVKRLGKLYYKYKEDYEKQSKETEGKSERTSNGSGERNIECKDKRNSNPTGQRRQPKANKGTKE